MMRKFLLIALCVLLPSIALAGGWSSVSLLTAAADNTTVTSAGISIPRDMGRLSVSIPTVTSGTVAVHVSYDGVTYYALSYDAGAAAAPAAWVTGSGTHNYAAELPDSVGCFNFVRFVTSAGQTANRSFRVNGQYK